MARKIDIESERVYENRKVAGEEVRAKQSKYYWATAPLIDEFNEKTFSMIKNRAVLEIGCSDGAMAERYAAQCNKIVGVDISDVGIAKATARNLTNGTFRVCDAHQLPFEAGTFDVVIVNSLLHHFDLNVVLSEIARVLKLDGQLCAREPLGTNPAFALYRALTPEARTIDERPFTFSDLKVLPTLFTEDTVVYFGFLTIFSAFFHAKSLRELLVAVDRIIAKTPAKYFFWQFYGFYSKK